MISIFVVLLQTKRLAHSHGCVCKQTDKVFGRKNRIGPGLCAGCELVVHLQGTEAPMECLPLRVGGIIPKTNNPDVFLGRNLVPSQCLKGDVIYGHLLLLPRSSTLPSVCSPGITHPAELLCLHTGLPCSPKGLTDRACVSQVFCDYI